MASTFYFVGGEDHDFTKIGNCTVDTATTAARRTANARCALKITASSLTDGWGGTFSAPISSFWFTARGYNSFTPSNQSSDLITLNDTAGNRRLLFRCANGVYTLARRTAAGTLTTLATTTVTPPTGSIVKYDICVTGFGNAGSVQVYADGTPLINYSGDLAGDATTSLNGFVIGVMGSSGSVSWSEVICSDADTRSMSLVTLAPSANGNAFNWDSGSFSTVNEVTLDDATLMSSATAGQLAQFAISSAGITGTPAVKAVVISARAAKGGTGPQNAKLNVRTGGANYLTGATALPAALGRLQGVFATNPATSGPWAYSDLTAAGFNVGIQSEA